MQGDGPDQWKNSPVVIGYVGRWTEDGPPPYAAWVKPMLTWGVFLGALYGSLLCGSPSSAGSGSRTSGWRSRWPRSSWR